MAYLVRYIIKPSAYKKVFSYEIKKTPCLVLLAACSVILTFLKGPLSLTSQTTKVKYGHSTFQDIRP